MSKYATSEFYINHFCWDLIFLIAKCFDLSKKIEHYAESDHITHENEIITFFDTYIRLKIFQVDKNYIHAYLKPDIVYNTYICT